MKTIKIIVCLLSLLGSPMSSWAYVGEIFTATTSEGVEMTFKVTSETKKTCQVGDDIHAAITPEAGDEKVTIPQSANGYKVTKIGESAFGYCEYLVSISIPTSVTELGYAAFQCSGITSITIPSSVKAISEAAFWSCEDLVTVIISNGVSSIEFGAFEHCSSLISITLPASISSLSTAGIFYDCPSLTSLEVHPDNKIFDSRNDCNAIIESKTNTLFVGCKNTVIPSSVTKIANMAFWGVSSLTDIEIPEGIVSIGQWAFRDCDLRRLIIPASVKDIGEGIVSRCSALSSIEVDERNTVYDSRNECNAIIESKSGALVAGCSDTEIPLSVTSIASKAFEGCSGLWSVTIPPNVTGIGASAFSDCSNLTTIRSAIKNPFSISKNTFSDISSKATLYVPKGTKDVYSATSGWPATIEELMPDKPEMSVEENGINMKSSAAATSIYYTTDGSTPTNTSARYESSFWPAERCVIKAMATIDDMFDSEITEYIPACSTPVAIYDGRTVTLKTSTGGAVIHYTTDGTTPTAESPVFSTGISMDSLCTIKAIATRDVLDNSPVLTYTLPFYYDGKTIHLTQDGTLQEAVALCGINISDLSAVIWEGEAIPSGRFAGVTNPNLLLYVKQLPYAANAKADGVRNIIANGRAESITLSDAADGAGNFYCPEAFTADQITYTHEYKMETGINECRGWETLSLPFDVETVTHETKGELTPMAINDPDKAPFWLDELTETGFVPTSTIKAYKPYIISMPNNDAYGEEYKLNGRVTFSAHNAFVGVTEQKSATKGNVTLTPCFERQSQSAQLFTINANETYQGLPEGSLFVPGLRAVRPFEAYVTSSSGARYFNIGDFMKYSTGISDIQNRSSHGNALYDMGGRRWSGGAWTVEKGRKTWKPKR